MEDHVDTVTAYSDANWAGCIQPRKSTSGGCLMLGSHLWKTWSKTQTSIALFSAETDIYGTMKTAQESIGLISMAREFQVELKARLLCDASAALGVAQQVGIGKIRHLQTGALWLQEQ